MLRPKLRARAKLRAKLRPNLHAKLCEKAACKAGGRRKAPAPKAEDPPKALRKAARKAEGPRRAPRKAARKAEVRGKAIPEQEGCEVLSSVLVWEGRARFFHLARTHRRNKGWPPFWSCDLHSALG